MFIGKSVLNNLAKSKTQLAETILTDYTVLKALKDTTYCGYTERPDSHGNPQGIYQLTLDSGGFFGFNINISKTGHSPVFSFGEILPRIEAAELEKLIKQPFDMMESVFKREIERTLISASQALGIGSAVIYDRNVDSLIVDKAGQLVNPEKQMSTVGLMNILVPYVKGLPTERLSQLRDKMPKAFIDFRLQLYQVVSEAISQGDIAFEALKQRVDHKVLPMLRQLEAEQKAALKKAKIIGLGIPLVSTAGILAGSYLQIPTAALLAFGATGAAAAVTSLAELMSSKAKAEGHPFYFLWKSKQK